MNPGMKFCFILLAVLACGCSRERGVPTGPDESGRLALAASTLIVNDGTLEGAPCDVAPYTNIQTALDAAVDGDTILICPGTYTQKFVVKKNNITVKSQSGPAVTTINGDGASPATAVLCANGGTLEGLTFDLSAYATHTHQEIAVRVSGDNNLVSGNVVKGDGDPDAAGDRLGIQIATVATGAANFLSAGCPANVGGAANDNEIFENEVVDWVGNGINVGGSDIADGTKILDNETHRNFNGVYNDRARNTVISGNEVHDNDNFGIIAEGRVGRLSDGTTIHDNDVYANGSQSIFGFGVFGFPDGGGIGFRGAEGVTNTGNDVHDNTGPNGMSRGVAVQDNSGVTIAPSVNYDNITDNDIGLKNTGSGAVDATCNWWGDVAGPSGIGPGGGDSVENTGAGSVDFEPWLTAAYPGGACNGPLATVRGLKEKARDDLTAIHPTGDKKTDKKLEEALDKLQESLDKPNWVDGNHIDGKKADKIFTLQKEAVKKLQEIKNPPAGVQPVVDQAILDIVAADRLLAQTAIDDLGPGADPKKKAKAEEHLAKGDDKATNGDYDGAIEEYKKSWKEAQKA